jgi:hypothetical protein
MKLTSPVFHAKNIFDLANEHEEFEYLKWDVEIDDFWKDVYPEDIVEIVSTHANGDDTDYMDVIMLAKMVVGKGVCEHYMYMPCDGVCGKCNHAEIKYKWFVVPQELNQLLEEVCKGVNRAWRANSSQPEMPF